MKTVYPITSFHGSPARQRGAVTLFVALIALVLITIMTVYTASVGVMDQRMSGNELRHRQAEAAAEAGLNQAIAYFKARKSLVISAQASANAGWDAAQDIIAAADLPLSMANGAQVQWARAIHCTQALVTAICPQPTDAAGNPITAYNYNVFRAQGVSDDGTGTAQVQQKIAFAATTSSSAPNAPVVAAGNVGLSGNYNIVANPNGGGPGVPISVWSNSSVGGAGSAETCHQSQFDGQACIGDPLSTSTNISTDVVANDPTVSNGGNFPDDVFQYLFGVSSADYQTVMDRATQITDCGDTKLNATSVGLYWYTGAECHVSAATVGAAADNAGTPDDVEGPVILVVQDADFRMNAGTTFNGIVFIFSPTATPYTVRTNGNAVLNGVLMTNTNLDDQINGTFAAKYDADILAQLTSSGNDNGPADGTPADVPGSWRDF